MSDGTFWDLCAAHALGGLFADPHVTDANKAARGAAIAADAMLAERRKRTDKDGAA